MPDVPPNTPRSNAAQVADCTVDDFRAGTVGTGAHLAATSAGPELILRPAVAAEFNGDGLPADWFTELWKEEGQAILDDGRAVLDGASLGYWGMYGSERSLEFVATFGKRPHQHVGFGTDFRSVPWITFSTKFGHGIYARSNFIIPEDVRLPGALLGSPHRYRIDWNVLDIDFWVDGRLAVHQLVPMVGFMRPLASNGSVGGPPLAVEWMRMTPYAPHGTFTSRVLDTGVEAAGWSVCELDADEPDGTSVGVEVRCGGSPEPDPGWSDWGFVDAGGLCGRYSQYRIHLATERSNRTPAVRSVTLGYSSSSSSSSSSSGGPSVGGGASGT